MAATSKRYCEASFVERTGWSDRPALPCNWRVELPTPSARNAEHLVYEKLMEKNQNSDPFKYILYSAKIGEETPAMSSK